MQIESITKEYLQRIGDNLKRQLPDLGFALLVFEFNTDEKIIRYISNAERQDMIKALKETVEGFENNQERIMKIEKNNKAILGL